jgi:hypothetical protein
MSRWRRPFDSTSSATERFYCPLRLRAKGKWRQRSGASQAPSRLLESRRSIPALRVSRSRVTLVGREAMNPDKLFDYLDGRLSPNERAALEERLMSDKQLQRELAVARQIHAGMHGDSREVVLPPSPDVSEQGRKMAIRIGVAFMILMFVNVGIGLWFIFRHESKNPNRPLLEAQMREQIAKSIERAATLTPAPNALGVSEITIPAETGKLDAVADELVAIASRLGGSATKGIQDRGRLSVFVDLPSNRESEFRNALASMIGGEPGSSAFAEATADKAPPATATEPGSPTPPTTEKKSFVVQIVEQASKHD